MTETTIRPPIVLKEGQELTVQAMLAWIQRPYNHQDQEDLRASLKGSAGTGKTTTLDQFIKRCPLHLQKQLCVTAPTHKAKKVIANATGLPAVTIQSLLGLKPNTDLENFDHNKPQFDPLNKSTMGDYRAVIIDETSMVNSDLFDLLTKESKENKTRILYVGDPLQLPPVGEVISRSLTELRNSWELLEVIRQQNTNPLAHLLAALREDILNGTNTFFGLIEENPSRIKVGETQEGYECLNKADFSSKMIQYFKDYRFANNKDFCKYTAWMNKSVKSGNEYIRRSVNPSSNIIASQDLLMGYSSISKQKGRGEPAQIVLVNSEDYLVTSVVPITDTNNIKGFQVILYREDAPIYDRTVNVFVVDHTDCSLFVEYHNSLLSKAKQYGKGAWKAYYAFKNDYILLADLKDGEKLLSKKDLDFGYGITVHKTQGSTYDNIFVNLPDIMKVVEFAKPDQVKDAERLMKQLIYVALSRARNVAYILID